MRHIVWDWNGTLFDDLHIVVASVNASLARFGEGPIDADQYRAHYRRPVPRFYESLLGRPIAEPMWQAIDRVFHDTYHASLDAAGLTADAADAVAAVAAAGGTQSILSMWWHDQLVPAVRSFGLEGAMLLVDGHRGLPGESKGVHLAAHLAALARADGDPAGPPVVIGDITDDAEAAAAAGVGCVLYDGGSQPADVLALAGVPVAGTLVEAVRLAGLAPA
ncbi:MAG: haloacid dehalogenase-like hydrolase [Actinobacteria bacterium]|nr:haloacid dehalogenase-like hydrolase [Actinomycetota bacterium]